MNGLYELDGVWLDAYAMLDDGQPPEDVLAFLEEKNINVEASACELGKMISNFSSQAKAIREEEIRLSSKRKALEEKAVIINEALYAAMKASGTKRIDSDLFSFVISKNPPSVRIDDEEGFLDWAITFTGHEFYKSKVEIDKKAVMAALKDGENVPGAVLESKERLAMK